ncbi:MAG: hypothetical protein J5519_03660, partial [Bacteroidales bacterium]|nr:hypothetical protein [Bacteroidales bacterium]
MMSVMMYHFLRFNIPASGAVSSIRRNHRPKGWKKLQSFSERYEKKPNNEKTRWNSAGLGCGAGKSIFKEKRGLI